VTATYMGGRRGPPDGDERPLRGLPGGRARPRPSPPDATPPDDGDPPGQGAPGNGAGGVVRPLRPVRVIPGGAAPPLRVIPGGTGAPSDVAGGDGHATGEVLATVRPQTAPTVRRRAAPRRRWLAAVLALVVLAGLAVTGRVVAERPRAGTASTAPATTAPATTASPGSVAPVRPSPIVATIATGGFSYGMATGAGALWVVGSDEVARIDPATDSITAKVRVGTTGSGPAAVAVGAGAVWVPVAVPGTLLGIDPKDNRVAARIPLGGPLAGSISVGATRDTVWIACGGEAGSGAHASPGRLLRIDPRRKRVVADVALPAAPVAIAADPSAAWVATASGQVLMVSGKRNRVAARIDAGGPLGFSQTIAVGAGGVWLADPFDEQIVRIDPKTRRVTARIPAGAVTTLAVTRDAVWALSSLGLVRVDPVKDRVAAIEPYADLRRARLLAADATAVWTAGWSSVSRVDPDLVTP
jgi:DNA-binding beta-propeller fold protein YncE